MLLGWWSEENTMGRHLWPGTSIGRMSGEYGPTELLNQIMITRGMTPESSGLCMFSMRSLQAEDGRLTGPLVAGPYAERALIPASPWLDDELPVSPEVMVASNGGGVEVSWVPQGDEAAFLWVIYTQRDETWSHQIVPGVQRNVVVGGDVEGLAVTAVDRCGNESAVALISL